MTQPTLFIPHGAGPCFFMEWSRGPRDTWGRMAAWLRGLAATLPEPPKALVVVSGHWEETLPTVTTAASPPLLYDYYGFPPHTYEIQWPAPGSPELATRIRKLLGEAGIDSRGDEKRGFDHGVFIPLKLVFPDADIPTVQLSLRAGLDPAAHLAMGRALTPLRDEGVLLVGSGLSFHNMSEFGSPRSKDPSERFDAWLAETVAMPPAEREERLLHWAGAPAARQAHPREEHLLPLMVAAGAGGTTRGERIFRDEVIGAVVSAARFG